MRRSACNISNIFGKLKVADRVQGEPGCGCGRKVVNGRRPYAESARLVTTYKDAVVLLGSSFIGTVRMSGTPPNGEVRF